MRAKGHANFYLVQFLDQADGETELSIVEEHDFYFDDLLDMPSVKECRKVNNPSFKHHKQRDGEGRLVPKTFDVLVRAISDSKPQLKSWMETMVKTGLFFVEDNTNPPLPEQRGCIPKDTGSDAETNDSSSLPAVPKKTGKRKKVKKVDEEGNSEGDEEEYEKSRKKQERKQLTEKRMDAAHLRILEMHAKDLQNKALVHREPQEYAALQKEVDDLREKNSKLTRDVEFYKDLAQASTLLKEAKKILRLADQKNKSSTPDCSPPGDSNTCFASPSSLLPRHNSLPSLAHKYRSPSSNLSKTSSPSSSSNPSTSSSHSDLSYPSLSTASTNQDVEELIDSAFPNSPPMSPYPDDSFQSELLDHNQQPFEDNSSQASQLKYSHSSEGVMEVKPGSGVYMKTSAWDGVLNSNNTTVTSAARKMLEDVFTMRALLTHTVKGGPRPNSTDRRALNPKAVKIIIERAKHLGAEKKWKACTDSQIIKSLGSLLSEARQRQKVADQLVQDTLTKEAEGAAGE